MKYAMQKWTSVITIPCLLAAVLTGRGSKAGDVKFVCIEPWHSLPSPENGSIDWNEKPAAAILTPGEAWSCTLSTSFVR